MRLSRAPRCTLLFLSAILFQSESLQAVSGTVPLGPRLYGFDGIADRAFQIAGAKSGCSACRIVVEPRVSDGFEMERSETLNLGNHAQIKCRRKSVPHRTDRPYDMIVNKQMKSIQVSSSGDSLHSITAPSTRSIVNKTLTHFDINSMLAPEPTGIAVAERRYP